jgi:hypothetical protein
VHSTEPDETGFGTDFPSPVARALVRLVVPRDRREEFEGDLIEEAETIVMPGAGRRRALRWFWGQLALSVPPMLARRLTKEVVMHPRRWIIPAVLVFAWGLFGLMDQRNASYAGFDWSSAAVLRVDAGSPAESAGLRVGDRLLSIGGVPVDNLRALQQQPRAAVGETRMLEVERTDASTGAKTTETIPLTYGPEPAGDAATSLVIALVGLIFLLSGIIAYVTAPSTTTFLFAVVGLCFGASMLPGPYIQAPAQRTFVSFVVFLALFSGFAALLHLMLVFPYRKEVIKQRWTRYLLYLPVAIVLLAETPAVLGGPSTGLPGVTLAYFNGIVLLGYAVLSVLALVHSYVRANPTDRQNGGLNILLAGLIVGLLPIGATVVAGMFGVRVDLLPGANYYQLTLVLIPASIALALVKGARKARPSYA